MDEAEKKLFRDHLLRQKAGYEFVELQRFRELVLVDHRDVLPRFARLFSEGGKSPVIKESGLAEWSRKLQLAYS